MSQDRHRGMLAGIVVLSVAAFIAVLLRLYAQRLTRKRLWWDGYILILGWILAVGCTTCAVFAFSNGAGMHLDRIITTNPDPLPQLLRFSKASYALTLLWPQSLFFIKLSLLLSYQRIFVVEKKSRTQLAIWILTAYLACVAIMGFFNQVFQCTPIRYFWDAAYLYVGQVPPVFGSCPDMVTRLLVMSVMNLTSDILILLLPLFTLRNMQLAKGKKWTLAGLFALGALCSVLTIAKIPYLRKASVSLDPTWDNTYILLFVILEPNGSVVCACLPFLPPLFRTRNKTAASSWNNNNNTPDSDPNRIHRRQRSMMSLSKYGSSDGGVVETLQDLTQDQEIDVSQDEDCKDLGGIVVREIPVENSGDTV